MPGVNLSRPTQEEEQSEQRSFFDMGIILSLVVLLLSGLTWGGIRLYIGSLDKKIAALDAGIDVNAGRTRGAAVDRVADLDARIKYFVANKDSLSEPQDVLRRLEGTMVPGIVLTRFDYNPKESVVIVEGNTDDFKKLAEQMLSFKSEKIFSQLKVDKIDRDDTNRIRFILKGGL